MVRRTHINLEAAPTGELLSEIRSLSRPLQSLDDLEDLFEQIGDSRFVLLGEASHGTSEFYRWRAQISQRLISEKNFSFIAVEGDWPDCYQVNRYIKDLPDSGDSAHDVLHAFARWPTWMWANQEVVHLAEWLREYNRELPAERKAGFFGLDVYSLWESLYAIMSYLRRADPDSLATARQALHCFEPYGENVQDYARATRFVPTSCEDEVVALLQKLRGLSPKFEADGREAHFAAEQNGLVLKNAEAYYRAMVRGGPDSWNIRDRHMSETLDRLMRHHGPKAKAIVWAHNTHVGDARYTDMADGGEVNIGQLARERHADAGVFLIGFGTYQGTVIAGDEWDAPMQRMTVPPAREGSWEHLLHQTRLGDQWLILTAGRKKQDLLEPRGHRAIGVVYHPQYEQFGNYVPTILPRRYDAFLFFEKTEALHPLREVQPVAEHEAPETYPWGV